MISDFFPRIAARILPNIICQGDFQNVYLTFDDGPDPDATPKLLAILSKLRCRATFFVTASRAAHHPGLVRDCHNAGHTISNHGYNHRSLFWASSRTVHEDLARSTGILSEVTGCSPILYRPPYGRVGWGVIEAARAFDLTIALWSLSPADYRKNPASSLRKRILDRAQPGDIILLHDRGAGVSEMLDALPSIVEGLRGKNLEPAALQGDPTCAVCAS